MNALTSLPVVNLDAVRSIPVDDLLSCHPTCAHGCANPIALDGVRTSARVAFAFLPIPGMSFLFRAFPIAVASTIRNRCSIGVPVLTWASDGVHREPTT